MAGKQGMSNPPGKTLVCLGSIHALPLILYILSNEMNLSLLVIFTVCQNVQFLYSLYMKIKLTTTKTIAFEKRSLSILTIYARCKNVFYP